MSILTTEVATIAAIDDREERRVATSDWLRTHQRAIVAMATRICVDRGINRNHYGDDVLQIAMMEMAALVEEARARPGLSDEIVNFRAFAESRVRRAVSAWANSVEGYNHMSEMTGWVRRRAVLERAREDLRARLRREPSDQEVVDAATAEMAERRSNPSKQGMTFTIADLAGQRTPESLDGLVERGGWVGAVEDVEDSTIALHSADRADLVRLTIAACAEESPLLGAVARAYLEPALDDAYDEEPSAAHIARVLDLRPSTARTARMRVRAVAREVLLRRYGITGVTESAVAA